MARLSDYALPVLLTIAYATLQVAVERRNYLLRGGGYGLGPQLITNPLRSLALIVAPLPGSEHADAAWLVPLGTVVALGLLAALARGPWDARRLVLALLLVLLPTAPFASPPDSRYLYLPLLAAALLLAFVPSRFHGEKPLVLLHKAALVMAGCSLLAGLLAWTAAGEVAAREGRFAAASGPGGSLWRTTTQICHDERPKRVIVVDPPLAAPHAEAIVQLACGSAVRPVIVGRDQLAKALKRGSVVIGFNGGSAQVEQRV